MWNNKLVHFLMVKITLDNKMKIPIPMPLILMDVFLNALEDLAFLADLMMQPAVRKRNRWIPDKSFEALVRQLHQTYYEMRKFGKWQLFDVKAGKVRISVEFV